MFIKKFYYIFVISCSWINSSAKTEQANKSFFLLFLPAEDNGFNLYDSQDMPDLIKNKTENDYINISKIKDSLKNTQLSLMGISLLQKHLNPQYVIAGIVFDDTYSLGFYILEPREDSVKGKQYLFGLIIAKDFAQKYFDFVRDLGPWQIARSATSGFQSIIDALPDETIKATKARLDQAWTSLIQNTKARYNIASLQIDQKMGYLRNVVEQKTYMQKVKALAQGIVARTVQKAEGVIGMTFVAVIDQLIHVANSIIHSDTSSTETGTTLSRTTSRDSMDSLLPTDEMAVINMPRVPPQSNLIGKRNDNLNENLNDKDGGLRETISL